MGEPIGDELDTSSEGGNIVLSNSGLTVQFTNGFHSPSNVKRPELEPDVPVSASSADHFAGRDPSLEQALALGTSRPSPTTPSEP